MTETDSDITRDYDAGTRDYRGEREGVGTNTNNDDITRGITNGYEVINNGITKGYEDITKGYERK
ncbi:MAG: hypothetical protein [Bacteriophage sp.]|nr:MAG: hypothetical protein [Bacteriophage sp.]